MGNGCPAAWPKLVCPRGFHTTVADDLADNIEVFRLALKRADVVISTGGIGPTQDDLTREAIASALGVGLLEDPVSLEQIRAMFRIRGREMPERNRVQALCPMTCSPIPNRVGTAPGVLFNDGHTLLAAMPGVPSEMRVMWDEQIRPRLLATGKAGGLFIERKINTFGLGESAIEEQVADLTVRGHIPEVGITASGAIVSLRILAKGPDSQSIRLQIDPVEAMIRERLGTLVFGVDDEDVHDALVFHLAQKHQTISVAEGVTGGLVGARLALVPGASRIYRGGIVAYDLASKTEQLRLDPHLIAAHGLVSGEVASAMAQTCRTIFQTDLAISTVGIAGPDGGSELQPVGTVFVACASRCGVEVQGFSWLGTRTEIISRAAKLALNLARLELLKGA